MAEALLIIDMLNDFVLPGAPLEVPDTRNIIPSIKREIGRARTKNSPVIYVCDAHERQDREFAKFNWPAHAVEGTPGAEVVQDIAPGKDDLIVRKSTYSAFFGTDLDEILRARPVNSLRLTGCVTHICILFTASDAVLREYAVTVVEDAVAGISREDHVAALRIMKNVLGVHLVKSGQADDERN